MASCLVFNPFWANFELDFDLDLWPWPKVKDIGTWIIECVLLGCTLVPSTKSVGKNSLQDMTSSLFFSHFWENLTLTFDLDLGFGQGHRHLGHWMRLIGLYLGTKYEVSESNRFWDMNPGPPDFLFDLEIWPLTLSHSSKNISLNVNLVVLPSYQVWSKSVKWFRNYLKLKFSTLQFCPPDDFS